MHVTSNCDEMREAYAALVAAICRALVLRMRNGRIAMAEAGAHIVTMQAFGVCLDKLQK